MRQVRRLLPDDITPEIHNDIYSQCLDLADTLEENPLTKYYDWLSAAQYLTEQAPRELLFVLSVGDEKVGILSFAQARLPHLSCFVLADTFLFIKKEHRTLPNALALLRGAFQHISYLFGPGTVVAVGNTLGKPALSRLYLAAGFVQAGACFIKEVTHE